MVYYVRKLNKLPSDTSNQIFNVLIILQKYFCYSLYVKSCFVNYPIGIFFTGFSDYICIQRFTPQFTLPYRWLDFPREKSTGLIVFWCPYVHILCCFYV